CARERGWGYAMDYW
nr:immunoglobulin heavy chain junction region [Mus musculus]MBK4186281.1 immunoglobulin heavy chain junction region [Mus musculus]